LALKVRFFGHFLVSQCFPPRPVGPEEIRNFWPTIFGTTDWDEANQKNSEDFGQKLEFLRWHFYPTTTHPSSSIIVGLIIICWDQMLLGFFYFYFLFYFILFYFIFGKAT